MEAPIIKLTVPFRPLLKKIANFLEFQELEYRITDESRNNAYVHVGKDTEGMSYVYEGGEAISIDDSSENASQEAVRDLMKRFSIAVDDITYAKKKETEERSFLYDLKRMELETIEAGLIGAYEKKKKLVAPATSTVDVSIDYVPVLFEIFRRVGIRCSPIEIVEKMPGSFVSWLTLAPSPKIAQAQSIFGDECSTTIEARESLAKKTILYLIPLYNLEIVDANYNARQTGYSEFRCALAKESCMTIRERVLGIRQAIRASELLLEEECVTPKGSGSKIPTKKTPPLPPKKRYSRDLGKGLDVFKGNKEHVPEFFSVPEEFEALFKRTKGA